MRTTFIGGRMPISAGAPRQEMVAIRSDASGVVREVNVTVTVRHDRISDVRLWLQAPDGKKVLLFNRRGHRGRDLLATFTDQAPLSVAESVSPFSHALRPETALIHLRNSPARGEWRLLIEDVVGGDGGLLESWTLEIDTDAQGSQFDVALRFVGEMDLQYREAFTEAAARWSSVITGDLPTASLSDGTEVDDVLIYASVSPIDGRNGVLGQAGPTHIRFGNKLPIAGRMEFDVADMADLAAEGALVNVITHEMGHVLGIGTLWAHHRLISGSGTPNPTFIGERAMWEYGVFLGRGPTPVPLESGGGPGTAEGHWRETALDPELMTGWLDNGFNPLSRITVASLADLGYQVDMGKADDFGMAALRAYGGKKRHLCKHVAPPLFVVQGGES